jgi:hypothetical protein
MVILSKWLGDINGLSGGGREIRTPGSYDLRFSRPPP